MATSSTTYTTFSSYPQAASSTRSRNPAPSSTASLGPSNVPGSAIKSGTVSPVSTATEMDGGVGLGTGTTVEGGGKGVNGLAIGLGVGVGLLVLLTLIGCWVFRQRRTTRSAFERRTQHLAMKHRSQVGPDGMIP